MEQSKDLPYPCIICGKRFARAKQVGKHVKEEHLNGGNEKFVCEICNKSFPSCQALTKHSLSHASEKPYLCAICFEGFSTPSQRQKHEQTHQKKKTKDNPMKTTSKKRKEKSEYPKKFQQKGPQMKKFNCRYCDRCFTYFPHKRDHEMKHILKDGSIVTDLKAAKGRPNYRSGKNYKAELNEDGTPKEVPVVRSQYTCNTCGKVLKTSQSLHMHTLRHIGKKNYFCSYCNRAFLTRQSMIFHERIHSGEKPFECKFCGKRFSHRSPYNAHERSHTGDKRYECSYCQRRFTRYGTWQNHERIHSGEKPHKCRFCEKSFAQDSTKATHERTHTMSPSARRRKKKTPNPSGGVAVTNAAKPVEVAPEPQNPVIQVVTSLAAPVVSNYNPQEPAPWVHCYESGPTPIYNPQMMSNNWFG